MQTEIEDLWQPLERIILKNRLPNALLFSGSNYSLLLQLALRFITTVSCENGNTICKMCKSCRLIANDTYPELLHVIPENSILKIEQIRELSQKIFRTQTFGYYRFVLLEYADKMNLAAANALLKILEEPPANTVFILLTEQDKSLPVTVLSRCQQYRFEPDYVDNHLILSGDNSCLENSHRDLLINNHQNIIESLLELAQNKIIPYTLAISFKDYALENILWILYRIIAQMIKHSFSRTNSSIIKQLLENVEIYNLFKSLDTINGLNKKLKSGININHTLAIENILYTLIGQKIY